MRRFKCVAQAAKKPIEESCRSGHRAKERDAKADEANGHTQLHTLPVHCHGIDLCSPFANRCEATINNVRLGGKLRPELGPGWCERSNHCGKADAKVNKVYLAKNQKYRHHT